MHLRHLRLAFAPLALLATAAPALADDAVPATAPLRFPGLAPDGLRSEINGEIDIAIPDESGDNVFDAFLEGQYLTPAGFGGYGRLQYTDAGDINGISNLELGGLYRIDNGETTITLRGGLVLPTGPDGDDGFDALAPLVGAIVRRPSDLLIGAPETTTLRLSAAPTFRSGNLVLRGDVGLDAVIDSDGDDNGGPYYHADLAAGFVQDRFGAAVTFSTLGSTDSDEEGRYHMISLGGQYDLGAAQVHASIGRPFLGGDGDVEFDVTTVALGVSAPL